MKNWKEFKVLTDEEIKALSEAERGWYWRAFRRYEVLMELEAFKLELHNAGFTVIEYVPEHDNYLIPFGAPTWFKFWKDGLGGLQYEELGGGYSFGTDHKPTRDFGTGSRTVSHGELTIENALKSIFPTTLDRSYKSVESFVNKSGLTYKIYEP